MRKYLGVFVIGGMGGFACATAVSQRVVAGQNHVQPAPATTVTVEEPPKEHLRHMRVHNQRTEIGESSKASQESPAAEQAKPAIDERPTGSLKSTKPRKAKVASNRRKKTLGEQDVVLEQAAPAEIESPALRGLFETLFRGN
ncbi:MAG: hypothetical protein ACR652_11675 [Methylocystis sp.]|uniref:hypothetical protein n=1 Tax=Methylocystis sp. TaxID=1911079 RepID=UPI003DA5C929